MKDRALPTSTIQTRTRSTSAGRATQTGSVTITTQEQSIPAVRRLGGRTAYWGRVLGISSETPIAMFMNEKVEARWHRKGHWPCRIRN